MRRPAICYVTASLRAVDGNSCQAPNCGELLVGKRPDAKYCSNACRQRADRRRRRDKPAAAAGRASTSNPTAALLAEAWVVLDRLADAEDIELTGPDHRAIQQLRKKVRVNGIRLAGDNLESFELRKWGRAIRSAEKRISG
jgi:hypothetical protein